MFKDTTKATDSLSVGLDDWRPPRCPCDLCGKETKEDHQAGWRVCSCGYSRCYDLERAEEARVAEEARLKEEERLKALAASKPQPEPNVRCPKCGKAMKANHMPGSMICSNRLCRYESPSSSLS